MCGLWRNESTEPLPSLNKTTFWNWHDIAKLPTNRRVTTKNTAVFVRWLRNYVTRTQTCELNTIKTESSTTNVQRLPKKNELTIPLTTFLRTPIANGSPPRRARLPSCRVAHKNTQSWTSYRRHTEMLLTGSSREARAVAIAATLFPSRRLLNWPKPSCLWWCSAGFSSHLSFSCPATPTPPPTTGHYQSYPDNRPILLIYSYTKSQPVFIQTTQPGHPSVGTRDYFGHLWAETAHLKSRPYGT